MDGFILAALILAAIGTIFLVLGIIFCITGNNKKRYPAKAAGQVIDMCRNAKSFNSGGDGSGPHFGVYVSTGNGSALRANRCPIFTYTVDGVEYKRAEPISYDVQMIRHMMESGGVDVYYDPYEPSEARLALRSPLLIVGIIFVVVALIHLALAATFLLNSL